MQRRLRGVPPNFTPQPLPNHLSERYCLMTSPLPFETLKELAASGMIDTVLVCLVDMQGRLMGKRFHVSNFLESSHEETHCCNYLLATDLEMATPEGYASTSWREGYGDYVMKPDLATCLLYTSPSPRDQRGSRMPSSA